MELLIELSTIGAAGIVASLALDNVRQRIDCSTWYGRILHTPRHARWVSLVLSGGIATAAAYAAQALGGPTADPAVTAAWAAIASQATHALRHLPTTPVAGEGQ
jgi:hypothetical protein